MSAIQIPIRANFGLLPEPQKSTTSVVTSAAINLAILSVVLYAGMTAKRVIQQHKFEQTELIFPTTPASDQDEDAAAPKIQPPPRPVEVKLEAPRINLPKPEPKPEIKPILMEAELNVPVIRAVMPAIILASQPKAALAAAAAPAQIPQAKPSTAAVHLGETFGVTPNPNATRPATGAAIGNPYGGMNGPAVAPKGVVGSTGLGNSTQSGSYAGVVGNVASAGIPQMQRAAVATPAVNAVSKSTNLEVLSKPAVQYTSEARQLKVQGDVVLRVTFTARGQVLMQGVVHGLGHGLDEEARRVASQIRFRPATRDGQPVDITTNITITFQLA